MRVRGCSGRGGSRSEVSALTLVRVVICHQDMENSFLLLRHDTSAYLGSEIRRVEQANPASWPVRSPLNVLPDLSTTTGESHWAHANYTICFGHCGRSRSPKQANTFTGLALIITLRWTCSNDSIFCCPCVRNSSLSDVQMRYEGDLFFDADRDWDHLQDPSLYGSVSSISRSCQGR